MAGRTYRSKGYRYGFNGKENDADGEWGRGLIQDYGFRLYNPAASRFLSVDPLRMEYPELTVYQFASNTPIVASDLDGLEQKIEINTVFVNSKYQVLSVSKSDYLILTAENLIGVQRSPVIVNRLVMEVDANPSPQIYEGTYKEIGFIKTGGKTFGEEWKEKSMLQYGLFKVVNSPVNILPADNLARMMQERDMLTGRLYSIKDKVAEGFTAAGETAALYLMGRNINTKGLPPAFTKFIVNKFVMAFGLDKGEKLVDDNVAKILEVAYKCGLLETVAKTYANYFIKIDQGKIKYFISEKGGVESLTTENPKRNFAVDTDSATNQALEIERGNN